MKLFVGHKGKKWTSWFWSYYYWSNGTSRTTRTTSTEVRKTHFKGDVITSTGDDQYMRSRNTTFDAKLLKPTTQHYQFMDNQVLVWTLFQNCWRYQMIQV